MRAGAGGEETKGRVMAARKARQRWTCSRPTVGPGRGAGGRRCAAQEGGWRGAGGGRGEEGEVRGEELQDLARSRAANLKIETVLLVQYSWSLIIENAGKD